MRDARGTATLVGTASVEQLDDSLGALELGDGELAEIERCGEGG